MFTLGLLHQQAKKVHRPHCPPQRFPQSVTPLIPAAFDIRSRSPLVSPEPVLVCAKVSEIVLGRHPRSPSIGYIEGIVAILGRDRYSSILANGPERSLLRATHFPI